MSRYRVSISKRAGNIGRLQVRRLPLLWIIPRWQTIAAGQAEDLQRVCTWLNRLPDIGPLRRPSPVFTSSLIV